jgi:hypothetical protein
MTDMDSDVERRKSSAETASTSGRAMLRVGCALLPKKVRSWPRRQPAAICRHVVASVAGGLALVRTQCEPGRCVAQVSRYLTPHMLEVASQAGLDLCIINPSVPLEQQGPFDAIIHKLRPNQGASPRWPLGPRLGAIPPRP